jgi:hypothetical protein
MYNKTLCSGRLSIVMNFLFHGQFQNLKILKDRYKFINGVCNFSAEKKYYLKKSNMPKIFQAKVERDDYNTGNYCALF